ncbi:MAG TPA: hypothetical protein VEH27_19930 [Methylomirabilota bacterium]|nr:hypothetical protein [Methylomirabilota bacterium]
MTMTSFQFGPVRALALAGMLLTTHAIFAGGKDRQEKSFDVQSGGTLIVEADRGNVHVRSGDTDKVQVTVEREHKGSDSDAADALAAHKIDMAQSSNTVTVKGSKQKSGWNNKFNKLQVNYTITVPKQFDLQIGTAGGNVKVAAVKGTHKLDTAGGNIDLRDTVGTATAKTAGGNIVAINCDGPLVARTSGGNIEATAIGGDLKADTSGGNVSVSGVKGAATLKTSGGNIQARDLASSVNAKTHGGNVHARFSKAPPADCTLETSAGTITVEVPGDAAFTAYGRTSAGRVSTDFNANVSNKFAQGKIDAQINGGGPKITMESNAGDIRIRKI